MAFPELMKALNGLKRRLRLSSDENFFGEDTERLLSKLEEDGAVEIRRNLETAFGVF